MRNVRVNRTAKREDDGNAFASRRIYIAGRGGLATRITLDGFNNGKLSAVNCSESDNLIVNCAILLEDTLEKLSQEIDKSKLSDPVVIFAPGNFVDQIHGGTYLYWLMKGQMNDGTVLSADELELWKSINELLAKTIGFVVLKNISSAKLKYKDRSGRRIQHTWIQLKDNDIQAKAWARIPSTDEGLDVEEENEELAEEA